MTVSEPLMSIAGIAEDRVFIHMCYVAAHLSRMLPNFQFQKICKQRREWEPWLENVCRTHKWSHTSSPLVWREFGTHADNSTYIGGATQFWEFIREYYGIESRLTEDELRALEQDFAQEFEAEERTNAIKATQRKLHITISAGDESALCENLAAELFLIEKFLAGNGIVVKLYNAPSDDAKLKKHIKDSSTSSTGLLAATKVQAISTALVNCDVLIILDEILRQNEEATEHWLNRNRTAMLDLAAQMNDFAPNRMKVIFCSAGPTCFNAGVLATSVKKLDVANIVIVSAHQGLEVLYEMLKSADIPSEEIGCPPVWGFLGINHFVDLCNAVQKHEVYRPNNRALKSHEGTTLPLGVWQAELRSIFYMAHDKDPSIALKDHKVDDDQKCNAVCNLLKLWYEESCNVDGEIIPLGICSDGTFGIPSGIFFSQPVYLKENKDGYRVWSPCSEFPVPYHPNWILNNLIETARNLVETLIHLKVPSNVSSIKSQAMIEDKNLV